MTIEILYFADCPGAEPSRALVLNMLEHEGLTATVEMVAINDPETARAGRFLGSPTVQVNGVDIEPARRADTSYALACRTYPAAQGRSGVPPAEMIRAAILHPGKENWEGKAE